MVNGHSRDDLIQFLDYLGSKGLMNPQTASARKASANTLLGILSTEEALDITNLDMDSVTQRFMNLKGSDFKLDSVRVYKSRVEGAIRDFISYKKDPLTFKPKLASRSPRANDKKLKEIGEQQPKAQPTPTGFSTPTMQTEGTVFSIPIRPNVMVKVAGLPADLTQSEAKKIYNVLVALFASET